MILSIDPGREKCGLAVLSSDATVLERKVVEKSIISIELQNIIQKYSIEKVIIGSGTNSKEISKALMDLNLSQEIVFIPEKNSTVEAKTLYYKDHPPKGIFKWFPVSLLVPGKPIDDYAAVVLGQRYLKG